MTNIPTSELMNDLTAKDFTTRWFASEVLGTKRDLNQTDIKKLLKLMPVSDVGEVLAWGLGQMGESSAIPEIAKFLEHKNFYYRWRAVKALRDIGSDKARRVLENCIDRSKEGETRWRCAVALGQIGSIKSFNCLYRHLTDEDRYVRWEAVCGISMLNGHVEPLVQKRLQSAKISDFLAWRCFWILGRVGNKNTAKWIKNFVAKGKIGSKYVKYQADLALKAIDAKTK